MKLEKQALLFLVKLTGTALLGATLSMLAVTCIPLNYVGLGLIVFGIILMLTIVYNIRLEMLKTKEKIDL
jgi:hypothetical protein